MTPSVLSPPFTKRLLSVEEFYRMGHAGIFTEDDHVELIEGELSKMTPIGPSHSFVVDLMGRLLAKRLGETRWLRRQNPLQLSSRSYVEPDFAILRRGPAAMDAPLPGPEDTLLVIEVADSSLAYDRDTKIPLYSRHGITEAWLIDVRARSLTAFYDPRPEGYASQKIFRSGESVTPLHVPDLSLDPAEIFGKP